MPICLVSLVAEDKQWFRASEPLQLHKKTAGVFDGLAIFRFKSKCGLDADETARPSTYAGTVHESQWMDQLGAATTDSQSFESWAGRGN